MYVCMYIYIYIYIYIYTHTSTSLFDLRGHGNFALEVTRAGGRQREGEALRKHTFSLLRYFALHYHRHHFTFLQI